MPLDKAAQTQIIEAITAKAPDLTCPACRQKSWTITDGLVMLPVTTDPSSIVIGGPSLPSAALVCTVCGNTMLFNLIVLGLEELAKPKAKDGE